MGDILAISPADLVIDPMNPRLIEPGGGQRQAQRAIAHDQQRKLLRLAEDIARWGVDPATLPIVMRVDDRRYTVIEGNRRLTALKSLENPESINGAVDSVVLEKLRATSKAYLENPVERINCLVVKDREEANHWIELRHTGSNEGAGLVEWNPHQKARFRERSAPPAHQALDFLENYDAITPERRQDVPASTLDRLLSSPDLRSKVGVNLVNGELQIVGDPKKVARALAYVANDLAEKNTKVGHVYSKEQRTAYANNLPANIVVPARKQAKKAAQPAKNLRANVKRKVVKTQRHRECLIPSDCVLNVTDQRAGYIDDELRQLKLSDYENAIAVLFRVFIELSVDVYIKKQGLGVSRDKTLSVKMQAALNDLVSRSRLTPEQAQPVRRALQSGSFLAPSMELMNAYIHNQHVFPAPGHLRAHWDSLQPFMMGMWP